MYVAVVYNYWCVEANSSTVELVIVKQQQTMVLFSYYYFFCTIKFKNAFIILKSTFFLELMIQNQHNFIIFFQVKSFFYKTQNSDECTNMKWKKKEKKTITTNAFTVLWCFLRCTYKHCTFLLRAPTTLIMKFHSNWFFRIFTLLYTFSYPVSLTISFFVLPFQESLSLPLFFLPCFPKHWCRYRSVCFILVTACLFSFFASVYFVCFLFNVLCS